MLGEYQAKLNESVHPFYIVFQVLKVATSHKFIYNTVTRSFSSYCFTSIFTSADVIFRNISELHSTLSEARLSHECFFY